MNTQQLSDWIKEKVDKSRQAQAVVEEWIEETEKRALALADAEKKEMTDYATAYLASKEGTEKAKDCDAKIRSAEARHEMKRLSALHKSAQSRERKARDDSLLARDELGAMRTLAATLRQSSRSPASVSRKGE